LLRRFAPRNDVTQFLPRCRIIAAIGFQAGPSFFTVNLSAIHCDSNPVPTKTNPLGVKGAGEAGNVGALPAVGNALVDALSPLGIRHIEMPATPERVWRALRCAGG